MLLFARPVPGAADQLQLSAPDAQLPWTAATDAALRRIARELAAGDAPPAITGVRSAFNVPGALPGEGETQVFLETDTGSPAALTVVRRADQPPRWSATFGEVIAAAAAPPARDTLAWFRLACGLPRTLPDEPLAALEPEQAEKARADYGFVLEQLGRCDALSDGEPAAPAALNAGDAPA